MNGIITYPLQFTDDKYEEIKNKAKELDMTVKDFLLTAIFDKLLKEE